MTMAWMVLMVVGGLASMAAYVWLLVIAFRESTVWGLVCLCIPFAVLVFGFKFWNEAKIPFLVCLAGSILLAVGGIGYSMTSVNVGIEEFPDLGEQVGWDSPAINVFPDDGDVEGDEPAPEEWPEPDSVSREVDEVMESASDLRALVDEEALSILDEPGGELPPPRPHRDGTLVPVSKLGSLQGERVVIVLNTLERVSAYVVGVDSQTVLLRHRVGGGSVTYSVDFDDIKEVRFRRVP
ncbi:MAG: hypothetical protein DRJ61_14910 [Acidobacteria bacterium]|nr:MAG: hypothetical protein DRJ65_06675 [Acidobacteriota bacterium]RLE29282.1 MAG: hypothetical protein DRJ61_14910 [Acidobacteriota bacterium]